MPQFTPGEIILNGKYRIEKLLGEGAFGEVYLALHIQLNVKRALKVLRKQEERGVGSTIYGDVRRRFLQESRLGAQLGNQSHIIQVLDFEENDGLMVLSMEYAPGGSLQNLLDRAASLGKQVPISEAVRITAEVAEGLALLHSKDVVHRDIKPNNILFGEKWHAKLADLGLAQILHSDSMRSRLSQSEPHPGTPAYMSPEQSTPPYPVLTSASDVYALGMVLFEMLTGRIYSMQRPGTRTVELRPDVPGWLDEMVAKMVAQSPQDRPWNGAEVVKMLQAGKETATVTVMAQQAELGPAVQEPPAQAALQVEENLAEQHRQVAERKAQLEREARTANKRGSAHSSPRTHPEQVAQRLTPVKPAKLKGWRWLFLVVPLLLAVCGFSAYQFIAFMFPELAPKKTAQPALATTDLFARGESTSSPRATLTEPLQQPADTAAPTVAPVLEPTSTLPPVPTEPPSCPVPTWTSPVDGMTLTCIPAGDFLMGNNSGRSDEDPEHIVYLDLYYLDQTEVTNDMFGKFVSATGYRTDAEKSNKGYIWVTDDWTARSGADWRHPEGPDSNINNRGNHPVVQMSWEDANNYCAWAGRMLPTEAQWEKAARGTDGRLYPWGNQAPNLRLANFDMNVGGTTPVGSYPEGASPYGLLDMAGSVLEMTMDWYKSDYYSNQNAWSNPTGPVSGIIRVARGGNFSTGAEKIGVTFRDTASFGTGYSGFRCALDAIP